MAAPKTYPALKVLIPAALLVSLVGVVRFFRSEGSMALVLTLACAGVLAFAGLLFPRRPATVDLGGQPRGQIEDALAGLDAALARGELTPERHAAAASRLRAELKRRG